MGVSPIPFFIPDYLIALSFLALFPERVHLACQRHNFVTQSFDIGFGGDVEAGQNLFDATF
jgi:hypothetical protein